MTVERKRETKETSVKVELNVDGTQQVRIDTGLPFFNHMLEQLAFHAGWDLTIEAAGDLHVDDHHVVEDVALTLGEALNEAWRSRGKIHRYGQRLLPMDDALVLCAVDLCGRPFCRCDLPFTRETVGNVAVEMWEHFFVSLAMSARINLHLKTIWAGNNHHLVEAAFKSCAYAFREALQPRDQEASTKGVL